MESRAGEGAPGTCAASTRGSSESGGGGGERAAPPGLRPRGGAAGRPGGAAGARVLPPRRSFPGWKLRPEEGEAKPVALGRAETRNAGLATPRTVTAKRVT